jgi:hypothetical protein
MLGVKSSGFVAIAAATRLDQKGGAPARREGIAAIAWHANQSSADREEAAVLST